MATQQVTREPPTETDTIFLSSGPGPVVIEDAGAIFGAVFERAGPDLVLRNPVAPDIRITDYFNAPAPADLQSADGAVLRGDVVLALSGPVAPGQYAQAGAGSVGVPIGQVESVGGSASVQRGDGTTEPLVQSSKIFLGDVVQTLSDSDLSITFVDGTIFSLAADSRMVIDALIYTPGGTDNSATFNLVQGGFVFIAGQIAGSGGMEVTTPAATMGIRGTTVLVDVQADGAITTVEFTLTRDPDGGVGRGEVFDLDGNLIASITSTSTKWIVSTQPGLTREVERTATDEAEDSVLVAEAVAAYQAALSRFAQDGNFVTLDARGRSRNIESNTQQESGPDGQLGLDSEDVEPPPPPTDDGFDEGRLKPQKDGPRDLDVFRTALEDSVTDPVRGVLQSELDLAGVYTLLEGPRNGNVEFGPDGGYTYVPDSDFNGIDTFTYQVVDTKGEISQGKVVIEVMPVNDPPQIEDVRLGGSEDRIILGVASARDVDGDPLSYGLGQGALFGSVVVTETGAWSYTPDADFNGVDTFQISVTDGAGAVSLQEVTVEVAGVNDAPRITGGATAGAVTETTDPRAEGQLTASDVDAGARLVWSGSEEGSFGTFNVDDAGGWTYTVGPAAEALADGASASERFTATVTDEVGARDDVEITLTITGTNDAPVIAGGDVAGTLVEDAQVAVSGTLTAADRDAGAVLVWSGAGSGPFGSFTIDAVGNWTFTATEEVQRLKQGETATESFTAVVTDQFGASASQEVAVTLIGANDAPIALSRNINVGEGTPFSGMLGAVDADAGDVLSFAASGAGPAHGSLLVNPDGSFVYTPVDGFAGLDDFEFTVTDSNLDTATARASVFVQSAPRTLPDGREVIMKINVDPSDTPAGQFSASFNLPPEATVKLAIVLDSSGSMQPSWATQVDVVANALEALADIYADLPAQIVIDLIRFDTGAESFGRFQLNDPDLITTLREMPFGGGLTNWGLALEQTEQFFDAGNAGVANLVYFVTDGNPSDTAWQETVLPRLEAKSYPVEISAFGLGAEVNLETLAQLDPNAELLDGPSDLLAAFEQTSLFNLALVDLSVTLFVDGISQGVIADETAAGIMADGGQTMLPLASIDGLADLLGEQNIFAISAGFDLDRDLDTAELELFTSQEINKRDTATTLEGAEGSDLMLGSDSDDVLAGRGGDDLLIGFGGDDLLMTGSGNDTVEAGAGNDRILLDRADFNGGAARIDGGSGRDVLQITAAGDLNLATAPLLDLSGIEALDIGNGVANRLELTLDDILGLSNEADTELEALLGAALPESLTVYGDDTDVVALDAGARSGGFVDTQTNVTDNDGNSFDVFTFVDGGSVLATLAIDSEVTVLGASVASG